MLVSATNCLSWLKLPAGATSLLFFLKEKKQKKDLTDGLCLIACLDKKCSFFYLSVISITKFIPIAPYFL